MKHYMLLFILVINACHTSQDEAVRLASDLQMCQDTNARLLDSIKILNSSKQINKKTAVKPNRKPKASTTSTPRPVSIQHGIISDPHRAYARECPSTQCSGYTKKGNRCRNMTKNCNGRCFRH